MGCPGESSLVRNGGDDENAGAGQPTGSFAGNSAGSPSSSAGGSAGWPWTPLDTSDCTTRALGDCTGMATRYTSNDAFVETPALVHCSEFNPADGCRDLYFQFDENGCASAVSSGPNGADPSTSIPALRECLSDVFTRDRFTCIRSQRFEYHESCFIP
jgi:hypothetical protein